jgi:hypothetical protein
MPPQISPDGRHYWDEQRRQWIPLPSAPGVPRNSPFMSGFAGCGGAFVFFIVLMGILFAACASMANHATSNGNGRVTITQVQS